MDGTAEEYRFLTTPPFRCPFGGPGSAWLSVDAADAADLVALLRRAVATPGYALIFVLVPADMLEVYTQVGFQTVGIPSKSMCGGRSMRVVQFGRRRL